MPTISDDVTRHYRRPGLEGHILAALQASGRDTAILGPADLAPVDEFHVGGRQATADLIAQLNLDGRDHVLDVGSGIGGTARFIAVAYGCHVNGIDLTDEYVEVATALTARLGLADRVRFQQANALQLPFPAARFDAVCMLHVGMNIEAKDALFAELRRVLRRGGRCAVYDQMRVRAGDITYPVPWAAGPATSHLVAPQAYLKHLAAAGFEVVALRNRRDFAIEFYRKMRAERAASGLPPVGLHLLMGEASSERMSNMITAVERGVIAPVEVLARVP